MRAHVICPFCKLRIDLAKRKDRESWTGIEYAEHIRAHHPEHYGPIGVPYAPTVLEKD